MTVSIVSAALHASISVQCEGVQCVAGQGQGQASFLSALLHWAGTTLPIRSSTQGYVYTAPPPHTALTPAMVCSALFCAGSAENLQTHANTCKHLL